jgi:hypothetical protein
MVQWNSDNKSIKKTWLDSVLNLGCVGYCSTVMLGLETVISP